MAYGRSSNKHDRYSVPLVISSVLGCLYLIIVLRAFFSLPEIPKDAFLNKIERNNIRSAETELEKDKDRGPQVEEAVFPHVIDKETEYETILHPGFESLRDPKKPPPEMSVPTFWYPPGGREWLSPGGTLMDKTKALSIGSHVDIGGESFETIYVTIASYRDYQCPTTIESMYSRAKYPDRIRVAVVDQTTPQDRKCIAPETPCVEDPSQILCKYSHLISSYEMDAALAVGPVFARHLGHRMYRGEYYAMQIDAHVTFVQDWDNDLVFQWKSAKNEMCVLSTYLSDVQNSVNDTTGVRIRQTRPIMCETDFEPYQKTMKYLRHGQQPEGIPHIHNTPTIHPFWAAGFSFARGHFVVNVPYDQYLPMIFQGEEINIGLRGFTYGYDYYTPERSICFHMYAIGENKKKREKVKLFWENVNSYPGVMGRSFNRLTSIIRMTPFNETIEDWDKREIPKYGLGTVRNVERFLDIFGIHLDTMKVEQHLCRFVGQPMQRVFLKALRKDGMGLDYDKIHYKFKDPAPGAGEDYETPKT